MSDFFNNLDNWERMKAERADGKRCITEYTLSTGRSRQWMQCGHGHLVRVVYVFDGDHGNPRKTAMAGGPVWP